MLIDLNRVTLKRGNKCNSRAKRFVFSFKFWLSKNIFEIIYFSCDYSSAERNIWIRKLSKPCHILTGLIQTSVGVWYLVFYPLKTGTIEQSFMHKWFRIYSILAGRTWKNTFVYVLGIRLDKINTHKKLSTFYE